MDINVIIADYGNEQHAKDVADLLDIYAQDPMGGNAPLNPEVKRNLAATLAKVPHAFSVLCYVDGKPAGLANCFEGFSTFKCKPLINIHDLAVHKDYRRLGLGQKLLQKVEDVAVEKGCCKVTLEVLDGNDVAKNAYIKFGFSGYELDPASGSALFWEKVL